MGEGILGQLLEALEKSPIIFNTGSADSAAQADLMVTGLSGNGNDNQR
jgi:hypothetical protein